MREMRGVALDRGVKFTLEGNLYKCSKCAPINLLRAHRQYKSFSVPCLKFCLIFTITKKGRGLVVGPPDQDYTISWRMLFFDCTWIGAVLVLRSITWYLNRIQG